MSLHGLFLLGLINGLLPCGPVYVALAAALATELGGKPGACCHPEP